MTIIKPNKNNNKINLFISISVVILIALAAGGVFLYNQVVYLRHEFQRSEISFRQMEVVNAELKNRFYSMADSAIFESAINNQALVLEKNPKYIKFR